MFLDLTGKGIKERNIRISADTSSIKLKLPEKTGFQLMIDQFDLSSVKLEKGRILKHSEKEYISEDYENAEQVIKVYADLRVTTLTIE
jgi:hypothetical protein